MGGVRTALYNYLFAKQRGGDFIIRIEDTDSQRFVPGAEKYIIEALNWCGIVPDEGVDAAGNVVETASERHPHAPYRQSQRKPIYRQYAEQLVANGFAYYAFDTAEELGAKRVVSKATRDIQAKFLLRNGADEVIYPEKDIAKKWAERYSLDNIFDYFNLTGDIGVYEVNPLSEWIGKSIRESNISAKHKVIILGVRKQGDEEMTMIPSADYVINEKEHLMIMAENDVVEKLLTKKKR